MPSLRIVSVNDVYTLENLPRLATLLRAHREENPADAFLAILAGDFLAPSMLSSLDFGAGMVDCLNAAGITHVILGNHEDDIPASELEKRISEFRGTWIDTNAHAFGDRLPHTQTVEVGGVRVGLLGVVMNDPSVYRDVPFGSQGVEPANEVAIREATKLLASCNCVVPITHQPIDDDRALAKQYPYFPVIVGGHEHVQFLEQIGGTWIVKAGADAEQAAILDLVWPVEVSAVASPVATIRMERVSGYAEDALLRARVDGHMARVREIEQSTLLVLAPGQSLSSIGTRHSQTTLGTLVCTMLRDTMRAEVAILNGGGIRASRNYSVHFTYGDLKAELRFDNELVVVSLPGQVLSDAIAASRAHAPEESGSYLQVDEGVEVDPSTHRVTTIGGKPIEMARDYCVALVRNFLSGLDHIEPLIHFAKAHPERVPEEGSGRDAKHVLIESFALSLYRKLESFDVLDADHDGTLRETDLEKAIATVTHEVPSHVVAELMMSALDTNHDDVISREEAEAARARGK